MKRTSYVPPFALHFLVAWIAASGTAARGQEWELPYNADQPPTDAGILQLATGTWTPRAPAREGAGELVIYANTCPSGFFGDASAPGSVLVDEGRVPSGSSTVGLTGDLGAYGIDAFTFGYATRALDPAAGGSGAHVRVEFFAHYAPCAPLSLSDEPVARFDLRGLPGAEVSGELAAYLVTIDLVGIQFCLPADGDGVFDNHPLTDGFGVAMRILGETSGPAGFLLAGPQPGTCVVGDGTRWQNPELPGAGLSNFNFMRREGPGAGCIDFGGIAYAGLLLSIESSAASPCSDPGTPYCYGTSCPCANNDPHGGCTNMAGLGADLRGYGSSSVLVDDLTVTASGLPEGSFMIFFMAPGQQSTPFGGGLLCAEPGPPRAGGMGAGFFRFDPARTVPPSGVVQLGPGIAAQGAGAILAGTTFNFQAWYRDTANPCGSSFNLSNGYSVTFE